MPIEVQVPDVGTVEFPDDTSEESITAAIQGHTKPTDTAKEQRRQQLQEEARSLRQQRSVGEGIEQLFAGGEQLGYKLQRGIRGEFLRSAADAPFDIAQKISGQPANERIRPSSIPLFTPAETEATFVPPGGVVEKTLRTILPNSVHESVIPAVREFVGETGSQLTTGPNILALETGRPGVVALGAQGAAEIPSTIKDIREAAEKGDEQGVVKASLNLAMQAGGALAGVKMSLPKPVTESFQMRPTPDIPGRVLKQPSPELPPSKAVTELMQEGVNRPDAEALMSGGKTIRQVVEGVFSKFITPAWNADRSQVLGGHGEAWVEGYNDAVYRLGEIVKKHQSTERTANASEISKTAEVHGDVRTQPEPSAREVPAEVSSTGVQPQAPRQGQAGTPPPVAETTSLSVATPEIHPAVEEFAGHVLDASKPLPKNDRGATGLAEQAGLQVKTIADLDRLREASGQMKDAMEETRKRVTESSDPAEKQAALEQHTQFGGRVQLPREAIEVATNIGSAIEGEGTIPLKLGERPLDWRKNPEVADWLRQHGKEIGISLPEELTKAKEEPVLASKAESRTGTGLPADVPDRGPKFASELMEAARQLGAVVRSRATLRPGVLGQFVRKLGQIKKADRIEVGDIDNQMTVSHEIGHNVDSVIFPHANLETSQESLVQRIGSGDKKTLFNELKSISELMRGPMTGTKGHVQYRKSATELIADYFALYAHDPERARQMAPTWSAGFEEQLANHPDAAGVVRQLTEGSVAPTPAERPPSVSPPTAMPGKAGVKTTVEPPVREAQMAEAAQSQVKDAVRKYSEESQGARIQADRWRKDVPDAIERNDVGAFVEGIGNVEIPGDTVADVRDRMTPEMQRLAKDYRYSIEKVRQEINKFLKDTDEGEYLSFLQDYLPHYYANSKTAIDGAVRRFVKESPHAKERKLPTLAEARDLGLTPVTQDPATLYELSSNINWRAATNRKFLGGLDDIKTIDGTPAIVPWGKAPPGWVKTDSPLLQRIYGRKTPGGLLLWKGGAAVHPDIWPAVRQMIETPVSGDFARAYDVVNSLARAGVFAFSGFHDLTLRLAALGSMFEWYNPIRGLVRFGEVNPITGKRELVRSTRSLGKEMQMNEDAVRDAARSSLHFAYNDSESYQKQSINFLDKMAALYGDTPVVGPIGKGLRDLQAWRNKGLWRNTHDAYKLVAFNDAVNKALKSAPPGTDIQAVKTKIASTMNDFYGGQEWQSKFWLSPQMRKFVSRFFLAPDWTLSTLRSIPGMSDVASLTQRAAPRKLGTAASEGASGAGQRGKVWAAELAAIGAGTVALQYAINKAFGDPNKGDKEWVWDNEYNQRTKIDITPIIRQLPWHDKNDPTRHYMNLGKRPEEVMRWVNGWDGQIIAKAAPPVHEIITQLTGTEGDFKTSWKQDHETFLESVPARAGHAAQAFLPFAFRGNQFALTLPSRKGMTKYKAQQAYESVYELAADPDVTTKIRAFMRGVPAPDESQALPEMVTQITEAAEANGVPAEQIRQRAISIVRGHHYDLFFKAFQKGDEKVMNQEAEALLRFGATSRGMSESLKRRVELTPQ
jgi:hypothetical protein